MRNISKWWLKFGGKLSMMCCVSGGRKKTVPPVPLLNTKGVWGALTLSTGVRNRRMRITGIKNACHKLAGFPAFGILSITNIQLIFNNSLFFGNYWINNFFNDSRKIIQVTREYLIARAISKVCFCPTNIHLSDKKTCRLAAGIIYSEVVNL